MAENSRNNLLKIAKVIKSYGINGDIIISFREYMPEDLLINEPIFIFIDGLSVPFFISSSIIKGNKIYAHLESIDTLNDAEELSGKDIYVDYSFEEDEDISSIIGWNLLDEENHVIGEITDIEDIPGNTCIYINTEKGEKLIPLNDELIIDFNEQEKIIKMEIPQGLLTD